MDLKNIIINNLKSLDINFELLRPKLQEQLIEIESYINECYSVRKVSLNNLKIHTLNIKKISDNTTVSKATIYNNKDTLKAYIDKRIADIKESEELDTTFISNDKYNRLEEKYNDVNNLLIKITSNLIDINNLKKEIAILEDENKKLNSTIESLSIDNDLLKSNLKDAQSKLISLNKNNVIDLNFSTK